ncbi:hypothetical protein EYF80_057773 [Liparis tanakae]|uniref:Uncharacterized protein n=1 Tax=Liparis tanakae TaxID=230148 RepID=A0A4Z2ETC9_9TELE|nr:hypothetical protein EYF80_057773 [Liparis tanakae]
MLRRSPASCSSSATCGSSHCGRCCSLLFSSSRAFLLTDGSSWPISPRVTAMKASAGSRAFTWRRQAGVRRQGHASERTASAAYPPYPEPQLGGGLVGVVLHAASHGVDVAQDLLQQPETHQRSAAAPPPLRRAAGRRHSPLLQRLVHRVGRIRHLDHRTTGLISSSTSFSTSFSSSSLLFFLGPGRRFAGAAERQET